MKTTEQKIEETEIKLKQLKEKLKKELAKLEESEWLYIPELKIEIQTKIHHKNKTYKECEEYLGKRESIPTYEQIQWLRNSKYIDKLNLRDTWEFVQNPDKISKENGYVAGFYVDSDYAYLYCNGGSGNSGSSLGVRFVRKILKGSKRKKKEE